jgi:hypothetical protein
VWLGGFRNDFIVSLPVYLQLTDRGQLRSTPREQLCTWPNDATTIETIFGTPVVEQLSVLMSHFFGCLQYPEIFVTLRQALLLETEDVRSQIRGIGWVVHFSNRFFDQKQLDRERLVSWSTVMVENPIVGAKFRPFSTYSFM